MVRRFRGGCNNSASMFWAIISFSLLLGTLTVVAGRENPLVELSSREELAQMAGYGEEKLSNVLIAGSVLCSEACSGGGKTPITRPKPVSGASVAVSCRSSRKTSKSNWVEATTDEYGEFLIHLPSHLHAVPNLDKRCHVKVFRLPRNSPCHRSFTGRTAGLELSSVGNGIRTYTAHSLYLTPKPSQRRSSRSGEAEGDASAMVETP